MMIYVIQKTRKASGYELLAVNLKKCTIILHEIFPLGSTKNDFASAKLDCFKIPLIVTLINHRKYFSSEIYRHQLCKALSTKKIGSAQVRAAC